MLLLATSAHVAGHYHEPCPDSEPDPVIGTDLWIESHDGTRLRATLWYNSTQLEGERPVVLAGHGWAGSRGDEEGTARWLVEEGYVVLAWDARGFGESEGTVGLNGPDEWADISSIIDWLARNDHCPSILLDGPDDPHIGMAGSSYGGTIQLLAAAQDHRIDAIVPANAWNDLVHSLAPESLVKRGWVDLLYASGQAASHGFRESYLPPHPNTGGMDERLTQWYLEATATGRLPEDAVGPLTKRSPKTHLHDVQAHTLLTQGYNDTLFLPDEAVANHQVLEQREHAETHLLLHPAGHGHSMDDEERESYRDLVLRFYDRHLKQDGTEPLPEILHHEPTTGTYQSATTWPPAHTVEQETRLTAGDGSDTIALHQLPAPTSHTEWQQFSGEHHEYLGPWSPEHHDLSGATSILLDTDIGEHPVHLAGRPRLAFSVTPHVDEASLFVSLVDSSRGDVIYNQVTPLLVQDQKGERIDVDLQLSSLAYTTDGDQLKVRITTSDTAFHGAREAGTVDLHLEEARLTLPTN